MKLQRVLVFLGLLSASVSATQAVVAMPLSRLSLTSASVQPSLPSADRSLMNESLQKQRSERDRERQRDARQRERDRERREDQIERDRSDQDWREDQNGDRREDWFLPSLENDDSYWEEQQNRREWEERQRDRERREEWYEEREEEWERFQERQERTFDRYNQTNTPIEWERLNYLPDGFSSQYQRHSLTSDSAIAVELTSLSGDWVTVSINGMQGQQDLSFNEGRTQQTVYLVPGTYLLRFRPTLSSQSWQSGYLNVGQRDRVQIQFNQNHRLVQVDNGSSSWTSDRYLPPY